MIALRSGSAGDHRQIAGKRSGSARKASLTPRCSARARGDDRPDSEIDILIEIAPDAPVGLWEYVAIVQYLGDLFASRVDVADRSRLKPDVRLRAEREAMYAF